MTEDEFFTEIEQGWACRQDELLALQNLASKMEVGDADQYRRALVLMLYAHFEGGVKFSLQVYVKYLNELNITVGDASAEIAAASVSDVMHALRDPFRKCKEFSRDLPDDSGLHRFARDRELMAVLPEIMSRTLSIDDGVVDTDSNLKPVVLRRILYRIGLDYKLYAHHDGVINRLIRTRNSIAHGESMAGVSKEKYESLREPVFDVMRDVKVRLRGCLRSKVFLRGVAA
ncbi:hypothetical protein DSI35_19995 [Mycobacterium tuberculosis]|nr:hypothetical protein DSI35_19995 [Mycobacterium tuberculosis]